LKDAQAAIYGTIGANGLSLSQLNQERKTPNQK
jgi:hypothetical protein